MISTVSYIHVLANRPRLVSIVGKTHIYEASLISLRSENISMVKHSHADSKSDSNVYSPLLHWGRQVTLPEYMH